MHWNLVSSKDRHEVADACCRNETRVYSASKTSSKSYMCLYVKLSGKKATLNQNQIRNP